MKSVFRKMVSGYKSVNQKPEDVKKQIQPPAIVAEPQQVVKEKPKLEITGLSLPDSSKYKVRIEPSEQSEKVTVSITYPLIPKSPAKGEPIFAYTKIFWDSSTNKYVYDMVEPVMSDKMKNVYGKMREMLEQKLDIDFSKLKKIEARDFLDKEIDELLKYFNLGVDDTEKQIIKYYMNRDFIGLDILEPLMKDPNIEDISCDGVGIPLFVFHRNPNIGSVVTNIVFNNSNDLDSFIIRLAQLTGKSISISSPLLDGTLPDGSRIQATLGTDIAKRGSNFTIRKFIEEPLTPVDLINYGTADSELLAYLWMAVDYGRSILIAGGAASGKTTFLNVLSLFVRPDKKLISIEDTSELRLPHPHWISTVARTSIGAEGKNEVDMFELLRESLRQRPDYIIVGEVRGKEAYILFQQMATGHPSFATIHAENTARLSDRLTTAPISLPAGLISSLDIIVFLARMRYKEKFIRKTTEIVEMVDFDSQNSMPVTNQLFKWNPLNDKFEVKGKSIVLKKISEMTGISDKDIVNEFERRILVLNWMTDNNITDYRDVYKIFSVYYSDPDRVLSAILQGAG
ncbi:MAG: type II/IV secretion system ATPase subunit [Candidatus Aenigmarchaeota archaeon]|nr:type II/IV secretion system ATPase subunit [Candidatus Aenigmarchaeota archaeon]